MESLVGSSNLEVATAARAAKSAIGEISSHADTDLQMPVHSLLKRFVHDRNILPDGDPMTDKLNATIFPLAKLVSRPSFGFHSARHVRTDFSVSAIAGILYLPRHLPWRHNTLLHAWQTDANGLLSASFSPPALNSLWLLLLPCCMIGQCAVPRWPA